MDDTTFQEIETEFNSVLSGLDTDPALQSFKTEYEKLYQALSKSHDSEKRLMGKCRELNAELVTAASKVETVTQDTFANDQAMESNRKELEQAWQTINEYRSSELSLKENIDTLKEEIAEMGEQLKEGASSSRPQGEDVNDLIDEKKALQLELDDTTEEVMGMRLKLDAVTEKQLASEQQREAGLQEIDSLTEALTVKKTEFEREMRKKTAMEREKNVLQQDLTALQTQIGKKQDDLNEQQEELSAIQDDVVERDQEISLLKQQTDVLQANNEKLERQRDMSEVEVDRAREENHLLKRNLKEKEVEHAGVKKELQDMMKFNEKVKRQLGTSEEKRLEVEAKRTNLKTELSGLERDLDASKKEGESLRKELETLARARDMLKKKQLVAGSETEAQRDLVRQQENRLKTLDQEIGGFKLEAQAQRKVTLTLEKERDRFMNEAANSAHRAATALDERKIADNQIFDYKKKIAEAELRLKQQQSLYEQVRSDRNLYSKNYLEAQDDINEKKRKLKIMNHQIEQLKEEISSKETKLMKKHVEFDVVNQEKIKLKATLDDMKEKMKKLNQSIQDHKTEQQSLNVSLADIKNKNSHLRKQYEEVLKERDMLATQLTRRDDELKLVYEKIKIQQSTLAKGETQYRNRLDDIRLLKMEIKRLQREKAILTKTVANVEQLKREVYHAQRDLLRERTRCRALEEELETPLNVHRWRKLQGSDPGTYEKIQKIQTLQKRLITKTEEVVEKELLIQEKEKEYLELKQLLARQPGPEVSEQLQIYQQSLKDKTRQLRSMASELNMYQAESNEYKYEIERLARELQDVKKRYFEQKRKEMLVRDKTMQFSQQQASPQGAARFTGGGFNMSGQQQQADRGEHELAA